MIKPIVAQSSLVAYCGLYCGACGAYRKGRCPGCHENAKATWCKVRTCCIEHEHASCADCAAYPNPNDCKLFNNMMAKLFGFVFRSDRRACIAQIRAKGIDGHAQAMAASGRPSMRS
ncbi:MAG: hypothetical protein GF331_10425 [Chitinivibrionales bacterium]|nr:hypothetical protein [Chitinivibrionales bacterium]